MSEGDTTMVAEQNIADRRHFRRTELNITVTIRPVERNASQETTVAGQVKNVSLAGVYCYVKPPCPLKAGDQVMYSISVPREHVRSFPFTRLFGKGWVVRLEPIRIGRRAGESHEGEERLGLAVAFAPDITALGTVQS